jgi:hypothetical protein
MQGTGEGRELGRVRKHGRARNRGGKEQGRERNRGGQETGKSKKQGWARNRGGQEKWDARNRGGQGTGEGKEQGRARNREGQGTGDGNEQGRARNKGEQETFSFSDNFNSVCKTIEKKYLVWKAVCYCFSHCSVPRIIHYPGINHKYLEYISLYLIVLLFVQT